eukprot:2049971-Pyramimonas_sp.AAC.1
MSSRRTCHWGESGGGKEAQTSGGKSSSNHRRRSARSVGPAVKTFFQWRLKSAAMSTGCVCSAPRSSRVACANLPLPGERRERRRRFFFRARCKTSWGALVDASCSLVSSVIAWAQLHRACADREKAATGGQRGVVRVGDQGAEVRAPLDRRRNRGGGVGLDGPDKRHGATHLVIRGGRAGRAMPRGLGGRRIADGRAQEGQPLHGIRGG